MFFEECHVDLGIIDILEDAWFIKAYHDGYINGFYCPDKWEEGYRICGKPGGPWVTPDDPQSSKINDLWCQGWTDGHNEKHALGFSRTLEDLERVSE